MFDRRLWMEARRAGAGLPLSVVAHALAGMATVAQAFLLSRIVGEVFLRGAGLTTLQSQLGWLLAVILFRAALVWLGETCAGLLAVTIKASLRRRIFHHLQQLGPTYTQGERTGELINTLMQGVEALEAYFCHYLPQLIVAILVPLTVLAVVLPADTLSGVILILTAPLIPLFMFLIGAAAKRATQHQWQTLSQMSARFLDIVQGLTTLKALGQSRRQIAIVEQISERFRQATMRVMRVAFLSALALELVSTLSVAIIAVEIGLRLLQGGLAFTDAFFILLLAPEFYLPLRMLGARFHSGMEGASAAKRLFAVLDAEVPAHTRQENGPGQPQLPGLIRFENVHFAYQEGRRVALRGVSLEIRPGERVALVGRSGAGKSTIAHLLLGFITPQTGCISIDGSVPDTLSSPTWYRQVAWVPQFPHLFQDTVAANIRLACPEAGIDEVVAAARRAGAHEFICRLPQGYETRIGEEGLRLSGGQAQRLALARAFLKNAPLLIMDEPTSQLDPHTEVLLAQTTENLARDRTVLVIAHRPATIRSADRVIALHEGRVQEADDPAAILPQKGQVSDLLSEVERDARKASEVEGLFPATIAAVQAYFDGSPDADRSPAVAIQTLGRLLHLLGSQLARVLASVLLGTLTIASNIGLLTTSAYLISAAALQPSIAALSVPIVGVRFFGLARGVFRYLERLASHSVTFRLLARLRLLLFTSMERLAPSHLLRYGSGDLLNHSLADVETLQVFYARTVGPTVVAAFITSGVSLFLAAVDRRLALTFLGGALLAGLVLPLFVRFAARRPGRQIVRLRASLNAAYVDGLQGMADLQAYGQSAKLAEKVQGLVGALALEQRAMAWISGTQEAAGQFISQVTGWSILLLAIPLVDSGRIDGVYLAALVLLSQAAFEAFQPLSQAAQQVESSVRAAARLFAVADAGPQVEDPPDAAEVPQTPHLAARELTFCYKAGEPPVLENVSLEVPPGAKVAIVGPSGAGKSTLSSLLLRFWEYEHGEIWLGQRDLKAYAQEDVRALLSVIDQRTYLFNASIYDNIRLAKPGAGYREIEEAARRALLHEFIVGLPAGYETVIGERGAQLSGGQRQRVALARALLRNSPILILDEPTANLDPLTEQMILKTILDCTRDRTLLLITHRLVNLQQMDEIVVLRQGRVVERGTHNQLLNRRSGLYHRLWDLQQGKPAATTAAAGG